MSMRITVMGNPIERSGWRGFSITMCCLLVGLFLCAGCARRPARVVSVESQLRAMLSVSSMQVRPVGRTEMVSSYDRYGGNSDWAVWNESRLDPDGLVTLANLSGPGCVTRIWMTSVLSFISN